MSLRRLQNCNPLETDHFHHHAVEDEPDAEIASLLTEQIDDLATRLPIGELGAEAAGRDREYLFAALSKFGQAREAVGLILDVGGLWGAHASC